VLGGQNRWEEALDAYQQALGQKRDDLYTLRLLGDAYYFSFQDSKIASQYYRRMIEAAPEDEDRYFAMGQLMAWEGLYDEADSWLREAIKRNPNNQWW